MEFIEENRVKFQKADGVVECYLDFYLKNSLITILNTPNNYDFVHKGDELFRMRFLSDCYGKVLHAIDDGIFINCSEKHPKKVNRGYHLYSIYNTIEALQQSIFYSELIHGEDEFTKEPFIKGSKFGGNQYGFSFGMIYIRIEYSHNKHRLNVDFSSTNIKFKKSHILHFLLDDGRVLTFSDFTKPIKYLSNSERGGYINMTTSAKMTDQDIQILATQKVVKFNLMNDEGSTLAEQDVPSIINMSNTLKEVYRIAFKDYLSKYLSLYNEIKVEEKENGEDVDEANEAMNDDKTLSSSSCYVYLMVDTTNDFHKIGISNNPKYREHTLQSDKPTIELLCAKEYPSRAIAEAIESALHRVYANKRIRGEWFNLDVSDIAEIKQTLK